MKSPNYLLEQIIPLCINSKSLMLDHSPETQYDLFKKWFYQHGGRASKLQFPAQFGPVKYIGVKATETIHPNEVILAVPKKLIIGVSLVRQSKLAKIINEYRILNDKDDEETDFHILALFLIWQKQLGSESFYYPYLRCIKNSETILDWSEEDVEKLQEPTLNPQFIKHLKKDFNSVFQVFVEISVQNPEFFKEVITWQTFMDGYSIVMTRCFGWGLPETMLVPFADFFNHNSSGVHHYAFNRKLQQLDHPQYIKKHSQLNLEILGINNTKQLPSSYARNSRENFIHKHRKILEEKKSQYDENQRLNTQQTKAQLATIHQELLISNFDVPLMISSDSEDNDSDSDDIISTKAHHSYLFLEDMTKMVKNQIEPVFQEPKPYANREFEDDVNFDWWYEEEEKDTFFIIAASSKTKEGSEVFNSYGRRNNRFLLTWYGFTIPDNKYDSVPFKLVSDEVYEKSGEIIHVGHLLCPYFTIKNQQYSYESLSPEFRLKRTRLDYQLMAFLRRRVIKWSQKYQDLYKKKLISLASIKNLQIQKNMLQLYSIIVNRLIVAYHASSQRQVLSNPERQYFGSLLVKGNQQILETHKKSVYILQRILENTGKGMNLIEAYQSEYLEEEGDPVVKVGNRKAILDYLKMLGRFVK